MYKRRVKMELILFRLCSFLVGLSLIISLSFFSIAEYESYGYSKKSEEFKKYLSDKKIRCKKKEVENKSKQNTAINIDPESNLKSIDWGFINDCSYIETRNLAGRASKRHHDNAIMGLMFGFGVSFLLTFSFYSLRWILTGKIKPLMPAKVESED